MYKSKKRVDSPPYWKKKLQQKNRPEFFVVCVAATVLYANLHKFAFHYVAKRKEWNLGIMNTYCS